MLDAAMMVNGKGVALEVDGPSSFAMGGTVAPAGQAANKDVEPAERMPLGKTLLKRNLVEAQGWRVVSVPYWEWESLSTDENRDRYLGDRLDL